MAFPGHPGSGRRRPRGRCRLHPLRGPLHRKGQGRRTRGRSRVPPKGRPLVFLRRKAAPGETVVRDQPKIGRNAPCPCGSGKKYKKCCGG
ncbi:MAG: SEC-C metal-binding domain-containing protein [Desulfococcaceae bacterium]